jgi:hypothetical protein
MGVQQAVAALVSERSSKPALNDLCVPIVEDFRDNNGFDAARPKLRKSQNALGQVLVLGRDPESLLDEAVDPDRLR